MTDATTKPDDGFAEPIAPPGIVPTIPIQKFNDVLRVFEASEITLAEITAIADAATTHYGFKRALVAVRVQLGPGKWVYVKAEPVPTPLSDPAKTLRAKWAEWKAAYPTTAAAGHPARKGRS